MSRRTTPPADPCRAVAYLRVSTEEQAASDRHSMPMQVQQLREFAAREGHEVVYVQILRSRLTPPLPSRVGGRLPAHATGGREGASRLCRFGGSR